MNSLLKEILFSIEKMPISLSNKQQLIIFPLWASGIEFSLNIHR